MKKRLFALFLVLVMVVSMIVVPAQAEKTGVAENVTATTEICPCGCGAALDQVKWTPWAVNGVEELSSGHYYLVADITLNTEFLIGVDQNVSLCLNGKTVTQTAKDKRHYASNTRVILILNRISLSINFYIFNFAH